MVSASRTAGGSPRCASAPPTSSASSSTRLFEQMHVPIASVHGIAVASVVPPLTRPMEEMCERYFSQTALVVDAANAGMPVHYSPVGDVGADRIVNAVAAWDEVRNAGRRSAHRRRLRHGHDVRRHFHRGGVPGRRDLPGDQHLGRSALPARRSSSPRRRTEAGAGDRPDDGQRDAVGTLFRIRRDGGRPRYGASARSWKGATRQS